MGSGRVEDQGWRDFYDRTFVLHATPEGRPYDHDKILEGLGSIGLKDHHIELIGQLEGGTKWQIRLSEALIVQQVLAEYGTLRVRSAKPANTGWYECPITGWLEDVHSLRVHWLPNFVPDKVLCDALKPYVRRITRIVEERKGSRAHQVLMGTQIVVFSGGDLEEIPDKVPVTFEGQEYQILLTVNGLKPRCHKCGLRGHVRARCNTKCDLCGQPHLTEMHDSLVGDRPTPDEASAMINNKSRGVSLAEVLINTVTDTKRSYSKSVGMVGLSGKVPPPKSPHASTMLSGGKPTDFTRPPPPLQPPPPQPPLPLETDTNVSSPPDKVSGSLGSAPLQMVGVLPVRLISQACRQGPLTLRPLTAG